MTKSEFFYYMGQGVKYSPTIYIAGKPLRLNTFATAREPTDLSADNLNKNVFDRPGFYFYSRKWEAQRKSASAVVFDYPILMCYDVRPKFDNQFGQTGAQQCSQMILQCLYPNNEKLETNVKKSAKELLLDEIYEATSEMLRRQIEWIKGGAYMTVDSFTGWFNQDWVAAEIEAGRVTTAVVYEETTNKFRLRNKNLNRQQLGSWVDDLSKDALCGISLPYEFCEILCTPTTNWPHGFNWPTGYYDSDTDAGANGVNMGDVYYLSTANIYGMAKGVLKQRVEL